MFPRDSGAGGTWIALNGNGSAAVLLNGGFIKHIQQPAYRKSRGLAFLDIFAADDLYLSYKQIDLSNIEPFTVILWNNAELYECRWDGQQKNIKELDATSSYTWSSVTLYDAVVIERRKAWFENWREENLQPSMDDIIQFHLSAGDGDPHNDIRMNRDGKMLTVSIASMEIFNGKSRMKYIDLLDNTTSLHELVFTKAPVTK